MTKHKPTETNVICSYGINFIDFIAERRRLINYELKEFMWCRFSGQKFELSVYRASPGDADSQSDLTENNEAQIRNKAWIKFTTMAPVGSRSR
jgi:hypothetical protein